MLLRPIFRLKSIYNSTKSLHILALSSHPDLAISLANKLNCPVSPVQNQSFSNTETKLSPLRLPIKCNDSVVVVQSPLQNINNQIMELLLVIQACKQLHNTKVTALVPCFPYSRSDKTESRNIPIAAKLMAKMLEAAGADNVVTVDLHAAQIEGFFNVPITNLQITGIISDALRSRDVILVSPDAGAMKKVTRISEQTGQPFALIHKERGVDGTVSRMTLVGDVRGKTAVIVDDMADSCGTVLKAADLLKSQGAATVEAVMSHGILSGDALRRISGSESLSRFTVTNTLPQRTDECSKLDVIDVTDLLAETISQIHG